jgi:hypothetical protein
MVQRFVLRVTQRLKGAISERQPQRLIGKDNDRDTVLVYATATPNSLHQGFPHQ